ncbi:MAG TPA: hypothetical protein VFV73_41045 [Streptosporangiaceae bacterium]|nr:hypothetical protein [Streptosporangiaceae bacterium]
MTGSGGYVLANVLHTDRARLRPLIPGSPATVALRRAYQARKTWSFAGGGGQPAARPPACLVPCCGWPVLQA